MPDAQKTFTVAFQTTADPQGAVQAQKAVEDVTTATVNYEAEIKQLNKELAQVLELQKSLGPAAQQALSQEAGAIREAIGALQAKRQAAEEAASVEITNTRQALQERINAQREAASVAEQAERQIQQAKEQTIHLDRRHSLMLSQAFTQIAAGAAEGTLRLQELHHAFYGVAFVASSMGGAAGMAIGSIIAAVGGLITELQRAQQEAEKLELKKAKEAMENIKDSAHHYADLMARINDKELAEHERRLEHIEEKWKRINSAREAAERGEMGKKEAAAEAAKARLETEHLNAIEGVTDPEQRKKIDFAFGQRKAALEDRVRVERARDEREAAASKQTATYDQLQDVKKAIEQTQDDIKAARAVPQAERLRLARLGITTDQERTIADAEALRKQFINLDQDMAFNREKREPYNNLLPDQLNPVIAIERNLQRKRLDDAYDAMKGRLEKLLKQIQDRSGAKREAEEQLKNGAIGYKKALEEATPAQRPEIEKALHNIEQANRRNLEGPDKLHALEKHKADLDIQNDAAKSAQEITGSKLSTAELNAANAARTRGNAVDERNLQERISQVGAIQKTTEGHAAELMHQVERQLHDAAQSVRETGAQGAKAAAEALAHISQSMARNDVSRAMREMAALQAQYHSASLDATRAVMSAVQHALGDIENLKQEAHNLATRGGH
jgi:hypothetical protein